MPISGTADGVHSIQYTSYSIQYTVHSIQYTDRPMLSLISFEALRLRGGLRELQCGLKSTFTIISFFENDQKLHSFLENDNLVAFKKRRNIFFVNAIIFAFT